MIWANSADGNGPERTSGHKLGQRMTKSIIQCTSSSSTLREKARFSWPFHIDLAPLPCSPPSVPRRLRVGWPLIPIRRRPLPIPNPAAQIGSCHLLLLLDPLAVHRDKVVNDNKRHSGNAKSVGQVGECAVRDHLASAPPPVHSPRRCSTVSVVE